MADEDAGVAPDSKINVASNPLPEQAATLGRDVALVLATIPALLTVLGSHDLNAWIAYFRDGGFGQLVAALSPFIVGGVIAWRQWNTRRTKAVKVTLADAAPNASVDRKDIPTNA